MTPVIYCRYNFSLRCFEHELETIPIIVKNEIALKEENSDERKKKSIF